MNGYATQTWVNNRGYLTSSSLNGYATQNWVNSQGFFKNISSIYSWGTWTRTGAGSSNRLQLGFQASFFIAFNTETQGSGSYTVYCIASRSGHMNITSTSTGTIGYGMRPSNYIQSTYIDPAITVNNGIYQYIAFR